MASPGADGGNRQRGGSRRSSTTLWEAITFKAMGETLPYAYRKHAKAPCGDDGESTQFDKKKHRKYLGKYCFEEGSRQPIQDAKRDSDAKRAYYDFLEGLQQINQQEYLDADKLGKRIPEGTPGWLDYLKTAVGLEKEDKDTEHLRKFAMWEREVRRRSNAFQTQLFANDLRHRAQMGLDKEAVHDDHNDHMPIRKETYEMLTRLPEQDFTILGALLYIINILISAYSLYTQIRILTDVCPVSFMCPFQRATAGKPILAPPVAFRMGVGATALGERAYINKYEPWNANLRQLCSISKDDGCTEGGYLIQWPYVQAETGKKSSEVPKELLESGCEITYGGNTGWAYDHYAQEVINEYLQCPDKEKISFTTDFTTTGLNSTDGGGQGLSEFTYEPSWYSANHERTLECMEKALDEIGAEDAEIKEWPQATRNKRSDAMSYMRSCMTQTPITDGNKCNCGLKDWEKFAIGLFYADETTSSCSETGLWCKPETQQKYEDLQLEISQLEAGGEVTPEDIENLRETYESQPDAFLCPENEECVRAYKDEQPLHTAHHYGCWFTSPHATESLRPDFYSCTGAYMYGSDSKYRGMTPQQRMKQETLDMFISKRAMLIVFFLIKEGTVVTACCMQLLVFVVSLVLFLVFYTLFMLPLKMLNEDLVIPVNAGVVAAKDGVASFIVLLQTLCLSLSTAYRTLIKANQVRLGLVNPSIRDMNDKITSLANTVFSLAVLMTLEDSSESGIVASLVLTLTQLIFQMVLEKMKLQRMERPLRDLNENRLSKFETALLWVKIMEDFLSDDVQYNWVQIFYSKALLKPFDLSFPETLQPAVDSWSDVERTASESTGTVKEGDSCLRSMFESLVHVDQDKLTYQIMTHSMSQELQTRFGYDGMIGKTPEASQPGCFGMLKHPWDGIVPKKSVHLKDVPQHDVKNGATKYLTGTQAKHCYVEFMPSDDGEKTELKLLKGNWPVGNPVPMGGADGEAPMQFDLDVAFMDSDMFEFQPADHTFPDSPADGPSSMAARDLVGARQPEISVEGELGTVSPGLRPASGQPGRSAVRDPVAGSEPAIGVEGVSEPGQSGGGAQDSELPNWMEKVTVSGEEP